MLIRIRTPIKMYRIDILDTDTIHTLKTKLAPLMKTTIDDIILSKHRNYSDFLEDVSIKSLKLCNGDILYGKSVLKKEVGKTREPLLSHVKKKWTFQDLKDYEERNTHKIDTTSNIKKTIIDRRCINTFVDTCRDRGFGATRFAKLYGNFVDGIATVKTIYIPEQVSNGDSSILNIDRDKYYKRGLNIITNELVLHHIGDITFYKDKWKNSEHLLGIINKNTHVPNYVSLLCFLKNGEICVEAFTPSNHCMKLYEKNIIYLRHGDKETFTIKPEHTVVIEKNEIKDSIDVDFFYSPIPIIHKESKYKIHDLTFMREWRPRVYNFGQFRKYMKIHCPIPSLINTFIYDIVFLIYIRQFFNKNDFKLLLRCVRKEEITDGFKLIISSICGIK
tara:strand:+ start:373 stop:1542 length:1170 start_codon:yes stop_codon:yes gene_type:complete